MSFLSPAEMRNMLLNSEADISPAIYISSAVCAFATTVAIVLRVIARTKGGSGFGKDDYFLFVGFVFYLIYIAGFCHSAQYTGWDHRDGLLRTARAYARHIIINMSMYHCGMVCVKLSILFLYRRIFPSRKFMIALYVVGGIVLAWFFSSLFTGIFNCWPFSMAWDPSVEGYCIQLGLAQLILGIANIVLDFILLGLPLFMVRRLQMETRKKILLALTFGIGCIACIVSITRLYFVSVFAVQREPGWDVVCIGILSGLEISTAIIASCTVTFRPLIERVFKVGSKRRASEAPYTSSKTRWTGMSGRIDVESQPETVQPKDSRQSFDEISLS